MFESDRVAYLIEQFSIRVLKKAIYVRVSEVEPCHAVRIWRFDSAQRDEFAVFQRPAKTAFHELLLSEILCNVEITSSYAA
jgi:hypothetical protein